MPLAKPVTLPANPRSAILRAMTTRHLIVYCTCPDAGSASTLAELILSEDHAACVNLIDRVTSWFRWQGRIERADEQLLMIKTTSAKYPALERALRNAHPYEIPEIIAVPITRGLTEYLQWIDE